MLKSLNVAGTRPPVYPDEAGKVLVSDGTYEISVAQNVDEAVIALCSLPAGCIPLDFTVAMDDLDSGAGLVWDGGGIKSDESEVDQVMISASTVGQSAGLARSTLFPMVAPLDVETLFGIHITTAPGGAQAGTIRGILTYRATEYGV
jgi:hypothetical protein